MGNKLKVAALAIAGACLSVLTYIMGLDDGKKMNAPKLTLGAGDDEDLDVLENEDGENGEDVNLTAR